MNIIIPLGGKGERFYKEGYTVPKPLIKIYDKEMILYVLDHLSIDSIDKVYIIYKNDLDIYNFSKILKSKYNFIQFIPITYQTSGAVETILYGLQYIKKQSTHKKCVLLDCDTFYTVDILNIIRNQITNGVFYVNREQEDPIYSYIELDNNNKIIDIKEKNKISSNANTGCYVFGNIDKLYEKCKYVLDNHITFNGEPYTSCVIQQLICSDDFYGYELNNSNVFSLGTPIEISAYLKNTYCFLFDLDGTLVNTDVIYYNVWKQLLQKYNIVLTEEIFKKYIHGNSDETVIKSLIPFLHEDNNISGLKDSMFIENLQDIIIIHGVYDFIVSIYMAGHKCAIVTNCNRQVAKSIIQYCKLDKYIDFIIVGNECQKPKPYPDPYLLAMQKYNITANRSIIFEDSKSGMLSARQASPLCIVGITTNYNENELLLHGANVVINNFINICINDFINYNDISIDEIKRNIIESLASYNIRKIEIDDVKLKGGYISDVLSVKIITNDTSFDCVLKLENKNETPLAIMATKLGLYDRENYFYENISKYVNIKIPKFYGLIKNSNFNTVGILMENLYKTGNFDINIDLNAVDIDISLKIIDSISKLHIKFWNKHLDTSFQQLKKHNDPLFNPSWKNFIDNKWVEFKDKWQNVISSFKMGDWIVTNFNIIQEELSKDNLTLIHGDVKSPNIFYNKDNNYEPCFIDWQYICIGKGVQDIVFFLIESFTMENVKLYYPIFIKYYYIKLLQNGIKQYSYDEYLKDVKNAICYFPFFVAVWFGTTPEDSLIDKNFPFFFIQKLFYLLDIMNTN